MNKILCSTGALIGRPNGRDFTLLENLVPQLHCDGLEFLMYDTWYDKVNEIKAFMKRLSMPVCVFHLEKQIGELISHYKLNEALERMEINCHLASSLGAESLVLHLWNGIVSDKNIDYNIECYKYLEQISSKYNLTLTVENVVCSQKDPMTHLSALLEHYPNIKFTFDTKMADFHKQLDLIYSEENKDIASRIRHLHINDRLGEYMDWGNLKVLHLGKGSIDFDKFFSFIKRIGYKGDFTTEATSFNSTGYVNTDLVNETLDKIRKYMNLA